MSICLSRKIYVYKAVFSTILHQIDISQSQIYRYSCTKYAIDEHRIGDNPLSEPMLNRFADAYHDDVIKWKHFLRNWPFVREIHRSPVNFAHKGQWRGALMFSLIYAWMNDWVNNREAGDLRRQHGHYDVIVMYAALGVDE